MTASIVSLTVAQARRNPMQIDRDGDQSRQADDHGPSQLHFGQGVQHRASVNVGQPDSTP